MTGAPVLQLPGGPVWPEDAEHAVLSAMLNDAEAIEKARAIVRPEQFFPARHQRIASAILALADRGTAVDPMTLATELRVRGDLDAVGGKAYIGFLVDAAPTSANVEHHAAIVRREFEVREAAPMLNFAADQLREGKDFRQVRKQLDAVLDLVAPSGVTASALTLYDDVAIAALPDATAVVERTIYEDSIAVVVGKYGTMKTFLLLDLALCIGTGRAWHGRAVQQGAVLYVYAEGRAGIKKRVAAWKAAHDHHGKANVYFLPQSVRLTDPSDVARLLRVVERHVPGKLAAVVVDTVARNMSGDENKVEDMNRFVAGCDTIREATGAVILAAHHTGWGTERSRGSTSLPGAINTELLIERDDNLLTVKCTKQKDGVEAEANITLEAYPIGDSLALRAVGPNRTTLTRNERMCLTAVQSSDGLTSTEWHEASGIPITAKSSFMNARAHLHGLGYVKLSKKRYTITEAGKLAVGPRSNIGPSEVQPSRPQVVQRVPPLEGGTLDLGGVSP